MHTVMTALTAFSLILGQFLTSVTAAPLSTSLASTDCGDTYTVEQLDYLSKIAVYCGTTVSNLLALNPQITNPNLIYTGQVLRLTGSAPVTTPSPYNPYYYPYTTRSGSARVSLSTSRVKAGDEVVVSLSGFPANAQVDYRVGVNGDDYSEVYDGTVNSLGAATKTITIPSYAVNGEYWVVQVITTGERNVVEVFSHTIYITTTTYTTSTGTARVSLSDTQVEAGDKITVTVSGFPKNAPIDYRVGERGKDYSVAYDGTTNSSGTDSETITIPSSADDGENWVVLVITTGQRNVIQVYSSTIHITD